MLGEFEYAVLAAAARLGDEAYGAAIRRVLTEEGRAPSIGALYTTLDRLEQRGLVRTWMGEPTQERGGRAKRMVGLTTQGLHEAKAFYNAMQRVSRGVSWAK